MLVTCIGAVFCLTFMISLGILGTLYYKYSPALGVSRSLNIAYLGKPPKYVSRILLQPEEKVYPYLCNQKYYHSFEIEQPKTTNSDPNQNKTRKDEKPRGKKQKQPIMNSELSPLPFCESLKQSYFDRLNLEQQLYTTRVTMVDEAKNSRVWDERKLRVELTIAYLQHKKTRVKKFESIFYLQKRTLLGSTALRSLWEWVFPMQSDSYVSGDIVVDNSHSELLAMFVSVPAVRGLRLQQVNVLANLDLGYMMYILKIKQPTNWACAASTQSEHILAHLLPAILVMVAFFIASNIAAIVGIVVSLIIGKCLQKGWLSLDFGVLAESKESAPLEEGRRPSNSGAAIEARRHTVYDDLD